MVGHWGWHGMTRGPGLLGGFLMLLFVIVVAALLVWLLVRFLRSTSGKSMLTAAKPQIPQPDPVLETLRRRLAEGAITGLEYDELRQKLGV